jgi:phage repressor protein C with HTH and peptisase S24 domain
MLKHEAIWAAIDQLAEKSGMSVSGLAKAAGLDPTSFNKSKRLTGDGRARWPSTESLAKILHATNTDLDEFMASVSKPKRRRRSPLQVAPMQSLPLIGFAQAGTGGFFEDGGYPVGTGMEEVPFPFINDEHAYALKVSGDSMMPFYRDGDVIIVSPSEQVRRGDRVVAKTTEGEVMAKVLDKRTEEQVILLSLNPEHPPRIFKPQELSWIGRILWVSQ